jgi:hypothetical protein
MNLNASDGKIQKDLQKDKHPFIKTKKAGLYAKPALN